MAIRVLFDDNVFVHYHILSVASGGYDTDEDRRSFAGQSNGLCGAGVPGYLSLVTTPHTSAIPFRVELHGERPPVDPTWPEVVEVSFAPDSSDVAIVQWAGEAWFPLDLPPTSYRARFCADQMDEAHEIEAQEAPVWRGHLLQFWPAQPRPDEVVRQTSEVAAYWHGVARALPPPPTAQDLAEAQRQAAEKRRLQEEEWRRQDEERNWGGRVPSPRLREAGGAAQSMARLDRDLVDSLAEATPQRQRAVAVWAARTACDLAGLSDRDWVRPALAALERGEALADAGRVPIRQATRLPSPFDDPGAAFARLRDGREVTVTGAISFASQPQSVAERLNSTRISKPHAAVPAVFGAAEEDPLRAALDALWAAAVTAGRDHPDLLARCRAMLQG